ncbi:MAG: hypothetical protein L6R38_005842 [Xanthoria sp. 2 TBL-2021]|nr:MAG: hypothetical protein L6R38_005842 [Xanthoria sp. 2 TBL-2021]
MMYGYVVNQTAVGRRRNAIKPDDVEYLLSNQPVSGSKSTHQSSQRPSSHSRVFPPRKRIRSNEDCSTKEGEKPKPVSQLVGPQGMTPMAIQHPRSQQTMEFKKEHLSSLDSQSSHSAQKRPAKKRKHSALSDEEDYYDLQPALFDVIHPSEIKLNEEDVEGKSTETIHESFPEQVHVSYSIGLSGLG